MHSKVNKSGQKKGKILIFGPLHYINIKFVFCVKATQAQRYVNTAESRISPADSLKVKPYVIPIVVYVD